MSSQRAAAATTPATTCYGCFFFLLDGLNTVGSSCRLGFQLGFQWEFQLEFQLQVQFQVQIELL